MLRLKPLQQRRKRQNVHQRMEETHMDKWVCIEPVHCIHAISRLSPISAPPPSSQKKQWTVNMKHTAPKPNLIRRQRPPLYNTP